MQTDLERNPFAILGASLQDSEQRLVELETERTAGADADAAILASNTLRAPRSRLRAELGWLPGLAPGTITTLRGELRTAPGRLRLDPAWPALVRANLAAAVLQSHATLSGDEVVRWIIAMGGATQEWVPAAILEQINQDRSAARIPPVRSQEQLESELKLRHEIYLTILLARLDSMPSAALCAAVTAVADELTQQGTHSAPALIEALIGQYETRALGALEKGATGVRAVLAEVIPALGRGDIVAGHVISELGRVVSMWARVARPIQLLARGRGQRHPLSHLLAGEIHQVVRLTHARSPRCARLLKQLMQEPFAALPQGLEP